MSDLPVAHMKVPTQSKRSPAKTKGRSKRQSAITGHQKHVSYPERECQCGCGESFKPGRSDQRFLAGHRFRHYSTHACPLCSVVHRVGAKYADKI